MCSLLNWQLQPRVIWVHNSYFFLKWDNAMLSGAPKMTVSKSPKEWCENSVCRCQGMRERFWTQFLFLCIFQDTLLPVWLQNISIRRLLYKRQAFASWFWGMDIKSWWLILRFWGYIATPWKYVRQACIICTPPVIPRKERNWQITFSPGNSKSLGLFCAKMFLNQTHAFESCCGQGD